MKNYIPLKEASEILGIKECNFSVKASKTFQFTHREPGRRKVWFDINGYKELESLEEELTEKTKLFVEYLKHIEDESYTKIAIMSGTTTSNITKLDFGIKIARRIATAYRKNKPHLIDRFDEYYGWKTARRIA